MMSSPCYDDVIPESYVPNMSVWGSAYLNQAHKQVAKQTGFRTSRLKDEQVRVQQATWQASLDSRTYPQELDYKH